MTILNPIEKNADKKHQKINDLIQDYNLTSHDNIKKRGDLLKEIAAIVCSNAKLGKWFNEFREHLNYYGVGHKQPMHTAEFKKTFEQQKDGFDAFEEFKPRL